MSDPIQEIMEDRRREHAWETARRRFIRDAAIAYMVGPLPVTPDQAWHMARRLWDAKPQDC